MKQSLLFASTRSVLRPVQHDTHRFACVPLCTRRHRSTEAAPLQDAIAPPNSRWLSDVKQRIGKCITFGLQPQQVHEAGLILQEVARDWRELVAGSEGFLTSPHRRGLHRRRVIWGEQDAMVWTCPENARGAQVESNAGLRIPLRATSTT